MKIFISGVPSILMAVFWGLALFREQLELNEKQMLCALAIIATISISLTFIDFMLNRNKKLVVLDSCTFAVFIITSVLEVFGIIDTHTYITIDLIVDIIDLFLDSKIKKETEGQDQPSDASKINN